MTAHSDILLDFNNMMDEGVGETGIGRGEIEAVRPQLLQIHKGLTDLRKLGQIPFFELPTHEEKVVEQCRQKGREVRERFKEILLIGIGGSSLGPRFLVNALGDSKAPRFWFCDSVDPVLWRRIESNLDFRETAVIAISKSGETAETAAALLSFRARLKKEVGAKEKEHLFMVTDPKKGAFRNLAREERLESFDIPPGIGGRYSVLTPAGLFPAACAGIDIGDLLSGAARMDDRCQNPDPWFNPAMMSAVLHYLFDLRRKRKIRVVMPYGESLRDYGPWFAQLWAESLGKRLSLKGEEIFAGTTPIAGIGPQDQHSQLQLYLEGPQDKTVTFIGLEKRNEKRKDLLGTERTATEEALRESGRPNQTILLKELSPYAIGQLLMLAGIETIYSGELYNVNPFDQPAVEKIKRNMKDYLSGKIMPRKSRAYKI